MKMHTEFSVFTLNRASQTKGELLASGKSAEEVSTALGEMFKYEGDKLKWFMAALDSSGEKLAGLKRVLVVTYADGEKVPDQAVKVEEHYYVFENFAEAKKAPAADSRSGGKGGRGKGGRGGRGGEREKSSPWGMSPEEEAAKKAKSAAARAAKAEKKG